MRSFMKVLGQERPGSGRESYSTAGPTRAGSPPTFVGSGDQIAKSTGSSESGVTPGRASKRDITGNRLLFDSDLGPVGAVDIVARRA